MANFLRLFRCVVKASLKHGGRALLGLVPMAGPLWDIASDALADYHNQNNEMGLRAEIAALAVAAPVEARRVAEEVVREMASQQPPALQVALVDYLTQMPNSVRQSLRRSEDPTGTTVPADLVLKRPEALVRLLPQRMPRFKVGDRPIPGVSYELLELLGVGGFGEVWKARHLTLASRPPVALKFGIDSQADRALRNEAAVIDRVLAQGPQRGIVPLIDAYLDSDPPCLAYQFIEGGDLSGLVQTQARKGGLAPDVATRLVLDLGKTIAFAHRLTPPIAHRDLKPANILVQGQAEGRLTLWIADFGIGGAASSHTLRQEQSRRTSQQESMPAAIRGAYSWLYASPQQRRGDEPDPRDDVHALGVIWYQLLTGDLTAERPGGRGWRKKLDGRLVTGLVDLLESCIDDDPEERPPNATELANRIEKLLIPADVKPASPPSEVVNALGMKFRFIAPGTFLMGSPMTEIGREPFPGADETQHRVTLTRGFHLGVHQVTRGQFAQFVKAAGYKTEAETSGGSHIWDGKEWKLDPSLTWRTPGFDQTDEHPVVCISWNDAVALCNWLTSQDKEGRKYRLPTEAEWEYACRAGTTTAYPWSESVEEGLGWCNIADQSTKKIFKDLTTVSWDSGYAYTSPVGSFWPNAWGLFDMIGNAAEWCSDWYGPYPKDDNKDYKGPQKGEYRVFRGGSWGFVPVDCRVACRFRNVPLHRDLYVGCRVAFCLD